MHSVGSELGSCFFIRWKVVSADVVICKRHKTAVQFPLRELSELLELFDDLYTNIASLPGMKNKLRREKLNFKKE